MLFGLVIGCIICFNIDTINGRKVSSDLKEFVTIYNDINDNFYNKTDSKKLLDSAISGMVGSLNDPYSTYMNKENTDKFNQSINGEYVGIGVTVQYKDDYNEVIEVFDGSPAKKVGIKVGDILLTVDGKKVKGIYGDDLTKLIKGKEGTKVKIVVKRGKKEKKFVVTRKAIKLDSVTSKVITNNKNKIGYISITSFADNSYKQFKNNIKELEDKKIKSLIIDVRDNPGGHLSQVNNILDLFYDKKTVLYQIEVKGKITKVYAKKADSKNYPVVILMNNFSASASEVLASCFKDNYDKAYIVGEESYGKGTVQKAKTLSSGSSFKYTTQKWLTSKGKSLNEVGLKPDYEVVLPEKYYYDPVDENDTQLQKAIELLSKKESK